MILRPTGLDGCVVVEAEPVHDGRGWFARVFAADVFASHGLDPGLCEVSLSHNIAAGTLRGLHYQHAPHQEAKLVRCVRGRLFDVAVDLATRRWTGVELSEDNGLSLYIPEGFAHGFVTLEPGTDVLYQISTPYTPPASTGVRWDDPALAIDWPWPGPLTISERDRHLPYLPYLA